MGLFESGFTQSPFPFTTCFIKINQAAAASCFAGVLLVFSTQGCLVHINNTVSMRATLPRNRGRLSQTMQVNRPLDLMEHLRIWRISRSGNDDTAEALLTTLRCYIVIVSQSYGKADCSDIMKMWIIVLLQRFWHHIFVFKWAHNIIIQGRQLNLVGSTIIMNYELYTILRCEFLQ